MFASTLACSSAVGKHARQRTEFSNPSSLPQIDGWPVFSVLAKEDGDLQSVSRLKGVWGILGSTRNGSSVFLTRVFLSPDLCLGF